MPRCCNKEKTRLEKRVAHSGGPVNHAHFLSSACSRQCVMDQQTSAPTYIGANVHRRQRTSASYGPLRLLYYSQHFLLHSHQIRVREDDISHKLEFLGARKLPRSSTVIAIGKKRESQLCPSSRISYEGYSEIKRDTYFSTQVALE